MKNRIAHEILKVAKDLAAVRTDGYMENSTEYMKFVQEVAPKFYGKYRNGITIFPTLGLKVSFGSNETKFYFHFGTTNWGRVWSADDAEDILNGLKKLQGRMD